MTLKRILISCTFFSAYFFYLTSRIKSKRERMRSFCTKGRLENAGGPFKLMYQCKALGQVLITMDESETFEKNAKFLFQSAEFGHENVCKSKYIDICPTQSCVNVDIKYFIIQYFREVEKRGVILRIGPSQLYDIFPDSEDLKKDSKEAEEFKEDLKVFGMMIGLAIIHKVYLEIKFEPHFLHSTINCESLLETLYDIDREQHIIYRSIKLNYNGIEIYKFVPNSRRPFRRLHDPDPLAIEFSAYSYPFQRAAEQIFLDPFENSRKLIFEGMIKVCSQRYYTSTSTSYRAYSFDLVDLNKIISAVGLDYPKIHDFKDNIIFDERSKLFLRTLKLLDILEAYQVYQKVTGFQNFPSEGFSQLPRIQFVSGHSDELFPSLFFIAFEPDIEEIELLKRIRQSIKIK